MQIERVADHNRHIYFNLLQAYEAEFSPLTGKQPDRDGLFAADTPLDELHHGYLGYDKGQLVGLAAIGIKGVDCFEVCEYYILPLLRRQHHGTSFIHMIWNLLGGSWEIKQIAGAYAATRFWRRAISSCNNCPFDEHLYHDPFWGTVTRQIFTLPLSPSTPDKATHAKGHPFTPPGS